MFSCGRASIRQRGLIANPQQHLARRTMATSAPPAKQEWLVILPDHKGTLDKRMEVRPKHLEMVKPLISNFHVLGGALLDEPVKEGQPMKITGSAFVSLADTKEEVVEKLKKDIYYTSNIWDWDKVQIIPFKSAFRIAS